MTIHKHGKRCDKRKETRLVSDVLLLFMSPLKKLNELNRGNSLNFSKNIECYYQDILEIKDVSHTSKPGFLPSD